MADGLGPPVVHRVDEVTVWLEQGSSVHIRAVTSSNDPVELSSDEARRLASLLLQLAGEADES